MNTDYFIEIAKCLLHDALDHLEKAIKSAEEENNTIMAHKLGCVYDDIDSSNDQLQEIFDES